jgi:hypothetical protein
LKAGWELIPESHPETEPLTKMVLGETGTEFRVGDRRGRNHSNLA